MILSVLDSAGVPMVGGVDALLITVSIKRPDEAYLAAVCAIFGSLLGSAILFGIARKGGQTLLAKHTESRQGRRLRNWFERYGLLTVFIPALSPIPMPMKIPVFCAGALEVRWSFFLGVVFSARVLRYFTLAYLGMRYGEQWLAFLKIHWPWVVGAIAVLGALAVVILRAAQRMSPKPPESGQEGTLATEG